MTEQFVKMYLRINTESEEKQIAIKSLKNNTMFEIKYTGIVQLKHCSSDEIGSARINHKEENSVNIFPLLFTLSELVNKQKYFLQTDKFNFKKINFDKLKVGFYTQYLNS